MALRYGNAFHLNYGSFIGNDLCLESGRWVGRWDWSWVGGWVRCCVRHWISMVDDWVNVVVSWAWADWSFGSSLGYLGSDGLLDFWVHAGSTWLESVFVGDVFYLDWSFWGSVGISSLDGDTTWAF